VGLTSPALSYLLALLALGLLLAIIVCWQRMAARTLRSVALRTVSLVVLQVFVLASIFVAVNRTGEFYSSWSDLLGLDKGSALVIASTNVDAARIKPVVVIGRTPVTVPGSNSAGGVLETVTFNGQISGVTARGNVFLPAGYRSGSPVGHYPVIVDISDEVASRSSPYGAVRLARSAAYQIAAKQLEPVIIVMLPAALSSSDQGCLNMPAQTAANGVTPKPAVMAATFFAQDLPSIMESEYAASNKTANWGLLADSSGGYCALQLALTNSWVFSAAVVPDGSYTQPPGPVATSGSPEFQQQDNLIWLLQNQPMQPVSVLFARGSGRGAGSAAQFVAAAHRPMRVATTTLDAGSWPLASVLNWIGAAIRTDGAHVARGLAR
jgi:enterochelin esterase-like enzyme